MTAVTGIGFTATVVGTDTNLVVQQGLTFRMPVFDTAISDLTSYTSVLGITTESGKTPILTVSGVIGTVTVTINGVLGTYACFYYTITPAQLSELPLGQFSYQAKVNYPGGDVLPWAQGNFVVQPNRGA